MNGHLTTDNEPLTTDNQPLTTNQFDMPHAHETIERVFREEYGRIIATLIRLTGFDRAEEALQEAFTSASATWPTDGVPRNPGAWLTTVAHRKVVDSIRRDKTREAKQYQLEYETERLQIDEPLQGTNGEEYPDDRLRLIFTCCHPSISQDNQIALTLRTLGGLTTGEIARAFLLPETTLAQRLVRAKNKIRLAGIPYEVPAIEVIGERLQAVSSVIYLIFNEGYSATSGDSLLRRDLCAEAIRLGRLICELMSGEPENAGLLSLMLLLDSHRNARIDATGELVTLEEQDRNLWDQEEITEGLNLIQQALRLRRVGPYQLQAAIAAVHAEAKTAEETDWNQIAALYQELRRLVPSAIVDLNHAAAVAMSGRLEDGLKLVEQSNVSGVLNSYFSYHAARADLLRRLNRFGEAQDAYTLALDLTTNQVERKYVRKRLSELQDNA